MHRTLILAAAGAALIAATPTGAQATHTDPAPRIVFESDRAGSGDLYSMWPNGRGVRRLTTDPTTDESEPVWSPDRRRVAFERIERLGEDQFRGDIWVMNADGTGQVNLTNTPDVDEALATWSPDGTQIAFYRGPGFPDGQVWAMDADGTDPRQITSGPTDYQASWSPRGDWIAFTSRRDGNEEIYLVRPDGRGEHNLTVSPARDRQPDWSPDGRTLAFTSDRDGNGELYLMDGLGGDVRRVTESAEAEFGAAFSPDGRQLTFTRCAADCDVFRLRLDRSGRGAAFRNLTSHPALDARPDW